MNGSSAILTLGLGADPEFILTLGLSSVLAGDVVASAHHVHAKDAYVAGAVANDNYQAGAAATDIF